MEKRLGYFLLLCGLGLLVASPVMLWKVFYGAMQPPQAFSADTVLTVTLATGAAVNVPLPPQVNRFANLSLALMLMFFLAVVGGKIGSLGVQLIQKPLAREKPVDKPA